MNTSRQPLRVMEVSLNTGYSTEVIYSGTFSKLILNRGFFLTKPEVIV